MNSVIARLAVAVLAAAALGPAAASSASAAGECGFGSDATPPTVGAISVSPSPVVVGKVKQSVTATVTASDDCGVEGMWLTYSKVGDVKGGSVFFYPFRLVSGTAQSGTWQASDVLGDYQQVGVYEASEVDVHDTAYNTTKQLYPAATRLQVVGSTSVGIDAPEPARLVAGAATRLGGDVTVPSPDATGKVELQSLSRTGRWVRVAPVARPQRTTYASVAIAVRPVVTTRYRFAYLGDAISTPATSQVVTVAVAPAVTARAAAARVPLGRAVTVSGVVRPAFGEPLVLQRQAGTRWVSVATGRVSSKGQYRLSAGLRARGVVTLRVVMGAGRDHLAGASAVVRVRVG